MYIEKWWGEYIGGTDDTYTLLDYFSKDKNTDYTLAGVLKDFGIAERQECESVRQTKDIRYFDDDGGRHHDIDIAIDFIMDLSAILLECLVAGSVMLSKLGADSEKEITIRAGCQEMDMLLGILTDFAENPLQYDLAEMCPEEDMHEMAGQIRELCGELEKHRQV
ncbi:MAG: imm68 putative immunity domain-containing protein [Christensenellaceae bacterium]|jgi:hypothetical protein